MTWPKTSTVSSCTSIAVFGVLRSLGKTVLSLIYREVPSGLFFSDNRFSPDVMPVLRYVRFRIQDNTIASWADLEYILENTG